MELFLASIETDYILAQEIFLFCGQSPTSRHNPRPFVCLSVCLSYIWTVDTAGLSEILTIYQTTRSHVQ